MRREKRCRCWVNPSGLAQTLFLFPCASRTSWTRAHGNRNTVCASAEGSAQPAALAAVSPLCSGCSLLCHLLWCLWPHRNPCPSLSGEAPEAAGKTQRKQGGTKTAFWEPRNRFVPVAAVRGGTEVSPQPQCRWPQSTSLPLLNK